MKYPYLLLDADNTLFDFDAGNRHAFHEVCARYDIPDTDESFCAMSGATMPCGQPLTEVSVPRTFWL